MKNYYKNSISNLTAMWGTIEGVVQKKLQGLNCKRLIFNVVGQVISTFCPKNTTEPFQKRLNYGLITAKRSF